MEMETKPRTTNPAGNAIFRPNPVHPPSADVAAAQDPNHKEGEFLRDLDRASSNKAKERLAKKDT
jgi:hypothetical protein